MSEEACFPAFSIMIYESLAHWILYLNENLAKYYPQSNMHCPVVFWADSEGLTSEKSTNLAGFSVKSHCKSEVAL